MAERKGLRNLKTPKEKAATELAIIKEAIRLLSNKSRWAQGAFALKKVVSKVKKTVRWEIVSPQNPAAECFCGQGAVYRAAHDLGFTEGVGRHVIKTIEEIADQEIIPTNDYIGTDYYETPAGEKEGLVCGGADPNSRKNVLDMFREARDEKKKELKRL